MQKNAANEAGHQHIEVTLSKGFSSKDLVAYDDYQSGLDWEDDDTGLEVMGDFIFWNEELNSVLYQVASEGETIKVLF